MPPPRGADEARIAAVALPLPLDRPFDYAVPEPLDAVVRPGCRVLVPFGRRRATGIVVARRRESERAQLRPLARVLDPEPVLSEAMLEILRDAAEEFLCPIGIALAAALPAGSAPRPVVRLALTARGRAAHASGALRGAARALVERLAAAPAGPAALRRVHPDAARALRDLERDRLLQRVEAEVSGAGTGRERVARLAPGVDAAGAASALRARAPRQAAVLEALARAGPLETAELARRVPGAAAALRALARRGQLALCERERVHDVLGVPLEPPGPPPELTPEQAAALEPIARAVRERRAERFLLHGVTGSGKTEVYLRSVAEALRCGRQALVLVPEITLTHQILARLRARFGDGLAVLHSGLSARERWEQWRRLRRGATPIAVGARSALFAPLENLGLVVIDEEHDGAYKNEEGFRYHARELAARRARAAGCPLVLGSATPDVETRHAADAGELTLLRLPHRIGGRPLPAVEIVDLARARAAAPRGRKLILSPALRGALRETLADGGQALLLLNRRGFSTRIFCFDCGHAERCKHCDISLVYHAADQCLRCHYCDYRIPPPEVCSHCGAPDTALLGLGTQRVEEEVRALFPEARVLRLDRDSAARRGGAERVLRALREGTVDVVVGTQMVAKGHDFPGVRLVGVVLADLGLHLPDFRAAERTFQLLTQVAGRAGRGRAPGRVVLQTFSPTHYAVSHVRNHDYEAFQAEELAQRRALGYPPFGKLVHARVQGPDEEAARAAIGALADAARAAAAPGVELLGPAPAPLARLRDLWRFQLLVKGADAAAVRRVARALVEAANRLAAPLRAAVDPHPIHML
jgi:primosomal protein N' (replication factor Y)